MVLNRILVKFMYQYVDLAKPKSGARHLSFMLMYWPLKYSKF